MLSPPALRAQGRSVGTAPGAASLGPDGWPRSAGAGSGSGVCQGTMAAISCQDIAKTKDFLGAWPHLDGELDGGLKARVLHVLAF